MRPLVPGPFFISHVSKCQALFCCASGDEKKAWHLLSKDFLTGVKSVVGNLKPTAVPYVGPVFAMKVCMQIETVKDVVYLSSSHDLPAYLQNLRGVRWYRSAGIEDLRQFLAQQSGDIFVIIRSDVVSPRLLEAFLSWTTMKVKATFIFIGQKVERAAYQLSLNHPKILILRESEGPRLSDLVTRRIQGQVVKSRKQERKPLMAQVMLKKSAYTSDSPTGKLMQFLREGCMKDFSQGGAQISLPETLVSAKDFISLVYQDHQGKWVSVESQVRWAVSTERGEQIIGVQFLAVSA